jgi:DNA polymerase elongation subunit (family B)
VKVISNDVPSVLYYDIETTSFGADFGEITCFAYKWEGMEDVKLVSVLDYPEAFDRPVYTRDREVVAELVKLLDLADINCGHYSSKFDNKFVQARGSYHGYKPIDFRTSNTFDTCITARKYLRLQNNRLANVAEFYGEAQKTSMSKQTWRLCNDYNKEALAEQGEYCKQDVRALYGIAKRLFPFTKHLPNLWITEETNYMRCSNPNCGGVLLEDGEYKTKANTYQKFRCVDCGKWHRGSTPVMKLSREFKPAY